MDSPPELTPPAAAPPVEPGQGAERVRGDMSKTAVASAACGFAGILLPLVNMVAIGLGIRALLQIANSQGRQIGRGIAIVGICLGVIGIGANVFLASLIFTIVSAVQTGGGWETPAPRLIHAQSRQFAQQTGSYPRHVAQLRLAGLMTRLHQFSVGDTSVPLVVGDYDLANYDESDAQSVALRDALRGLDVSAPYYQVGDCWFVRLEKPEESRKLVAGWALHKSGRIRVVFDNGSGREIDVDEWDELWAEDTAERAQLGLPEVEKPAMPE